jgi:group II intron reverse transcriptase/maturase
MNTGYTEIIDADLSQYFDTIPHANLLKVVAERISDGEILRIIRMWLKAPIMEIDKDGTKRNIGGGKGNRTGTPQGGVISPLLSNLYLHILDRIWQRRNLQQRLGARIVRYADDIVILCRKNSSGQSMTVLRRILERLRLKLNEEKTKIVDAKQESFDFLGFTIRMSRSRRTGRIYPNVEPSKKSQRAIKDRVTELTNRKRTVKPLTQIVEEINAAMRGWVGYFHYRNSSTALRNLRYHAEERLRTHLRKRHKVRNRAEGYKRFSSHELYERHGLYKVPTTAGWTK